MIYIYMDLSKNIHVYVRTQLYASGYIYMQIYLYVYISLSLNRIVGLVLKSPVAIYRQKRTV